MRIRFSGETVVAGASQIGISNSVNGKRKLFGLADDATPTGQSIEIPDDPVFLARLCAELMASHLGKVGEANLDRHEGVYELAAARR